MRVYRFILAGLILLAAFAGFRACDPQTVDAGFEDLLEQTIYDYIAENDSAYSSFLAILEAGEIDKTLSAYNPDGVGYTCFLPDNEALDDFIERTDRYNSLEELLEDEEYVRAFGRYHVVNMGIKSDNFPFGALPEYTLSGDILTVSFIIEPDTSYYKINNQAPISRLNLEMTNGWVHEISSALDPVTKTTYGWLEENQGYSIFKEAVDATGFKEVMDINLRVDLEADPFTLFVEHDSIFHQREIDSFEELAEWISPGDDDYTNPLNPLYGFVGYHLLEGSMFLDDFVDVATNYPTHSEIPLLVNGLGLDILINPGKEVFDTITNDLDTTIIDYIGFNYDDSNILTQSGSVHFINQVMRQQTPSVATQTFEFYDEPLFNELRQTPGEYLIEDTSQLIHFTWSGDDLYFIETGDADHPAWGGDYIFMDGDFSITYSMPEIVQGIYTVAIRVETVSSSNAVVEVFIDGKSVGGLVDLSSGGNPNAPFEMRELGTISFLKYEEHSIEIKSLIPGRLSWDLVRFEPYVKE